MKNPKAYFIDIDRTLVKGHKNINLNIDDIHAIKTGSKKGVYMILSTGRSIEDIKPIWNQIKTNEEFTAYVIGNNGSAIWNLNKNIKLDETVMDEEDYIGIHKYVEENGYAIKNSGENVFYCSNNNFFKIINFFKRDLELKTDFTLSKYNSDNAKKVGIMASIRKKKIKLIVKDLRTMFPNLEIVVSGPGIYIEINKKGTSKGTAAIFLSNMLGFDIKDTVHIGDSMNDLEGFRVCGAGVAVDNAMKDLKKEATHFTHAVGKAGVANTIRSFTE